MADEPLKSTFRWGVGCDVDRYADLSRPQLLEVRRRYDAACAGLWNNPASKKP